MSKKIVIYYSLGGNTKKIADLIAKEANADIFRIDTVKSYVGSYDDIVDKGKYETDNLSCPDINPIEINLDDYDTIILGSPVWWYTYAPAMRSFLKSADLSSKLVYPFFTNGGWIGHAFEDIKSACSNAIVKEGLNILFDNKTLDTRKEIIENWIKTIA